MKDSVKSDKRAKNADQEFSQAAYHVVMFLVDHFMTIRKELGIDYESFIILQVVNSHWLYNKNRTEKITWGETWDKIEANDAQITLKKKKIKYSCNLRNPSIASRNLKKKSAKFDEKR